MKKWLSGFLTCLLLCGLVATAGAKTGKVMQELTYRDIRVSLDGKVLDLRNAVGDKVEPFMFDGTNYLPVRALAEALGLNVAWDGKEVMVVLTTPESAPPESETKPQETPPTAESPKNDYEITNTHFHYWKNSIGSLSYFAFVEVTNTGTQNLYMDKCIFDFEDNDGHLLKSENFISSCPDIIAPGEKGYFYNSIGSLAFDDVSLDNGVRFAPDVSVVKATGKPVDYVVSDVSLKAGTLGTPTIAGRVTNNTDKDDSLFYIQAIYYNASGDVIAITGTNLTDFNAGRTMSFEIAGVALPDNVTMDTIASYRVIPRANYFQF